MTLPPVPPGPQDPAAAPAARAGRRGVRRLRVALVLLAAIGVGVAAVQAPGAFAAYGWMPDRPSSSIAVGLPGGPVGDESVRLPVDQLSGLVPGDVRTITLTVTNRSAQPQTVTPDHAWFAANGTPGFAEPPTVDVTGLPEILAPGASAVVTVTVAAPTDWSMANSGRSAGLVVHFTGSRA